MQLAQLIQARGLGDSQVRFRDLSYDRRAQRQAVAWAVADYTQWHRPDDESACVEWAEAAAQELHDALRRADPTWCDLQWSSYFVSCAMSDDSHTNEKWSQYPLDVVAVAGHIVSYLEQAV